MLSFLANERLCSTMLGDEEPPPIGVDVLAESMEWTMDLERDAVEYAANGSSDGGGSFMRAQDCSMNAIMESVTQAQFNDTIEAMEFYIEEGRRFQANVTNCLDIQSGSCNKK